MITAIVASIIGSLLALVLLFLLRHLISSLVVAIFRFLLRRFTPELAMSGAPARSPRITDPPRPPFEYVARPDDEARVAEILLANNAVCVTGGPGIGKSCVAMAVAHRDDITTRFSDGIWWVDAATMDLSAMCEAVASALGTPEVARAKSDDEKLGVLRTTIVAKNVLIVLDNCENPSASHRFTEEAHRTTLVTSQHRPTGPEAVTLEPLTDDQCLEILERTARRTLDPQEEAAAREIITLLHGHPFAVALAGPQLENASAQQVLNGLKGSPWCLLSTREPERRALKASLDAAYKRLSGDQRRLFAALGVFGGPTFDLAAVQAVEPSASVLRMDALVRRSLVRRDDARYALHPLVRRYASHRLGTKRQAYQRMAQHYLALAENLGAHRSVFHKLDPDLGNVLGAMDWCLRVRRWEPTARIADALAEYLDYRGLWGERRRRLDQGRRAAHRARELALRSASSNNLAVVAHQQGDYEQARRLYQESLAIAEELGDRPGISKTNHQLGILAQDHGEYDEARRLYEESLAIDEELGNRPGIAVSKHQLGMLAQDQEDHEEARRLYEESLAISEELGDRKGIAASKHQLGNIAYLTADPDAAQRLYKESLAINEDLGNRPAIASSKAQLGRLAEEEGDTAAARELYQEALAIFESLGSPEAERARRDLERVSSSRRQRRKKNQ